MTAHSKQVTSRTPIHSAASDSSLIEVLHAPGPDEEREPQLTLYSFLIGKWELDITTLLEDGSIHLGNGEIHAGWILRGRGIQDVWMIPLLRDRKLGMDPLPGAGNWYGTTLRIYDPNIEAWRILWSDPANNFFTQQIGRAKGRDIVQEGPDPRGGYMRWMFSEIQQASFHWTAECSQDKNSWRREVDIHARRT